MEYHLTWIHIGDPKIYHIIFGPINCCKKWILPHYSMKNYFKSVEEHQYHKYHDYNYHLVINLFEKFILDFKTTSLEKFRYFKTRYQRWYSLTIFKLFLQCQQHRFINAIVFVIEAFDTDFLYIRLIKPIVVIAQQNVIESYRRNFIIPADVNDLNKIQVF